MAAAEITLSAHLSGAIFVVFVLPDVFHNVIVVELVVDVVFEEVVLLVVQVVNFFVDLSRLNLE